MNLEEEVRNGYTVSKKMKQVWAVQIDLVKKLLEVCQKHNLKIWADGGTLLGTIRHKGYIPWDDDIDMAMMREDYDKLIAIGQKEFKHPYFLQSGYVEEFNRGFARLRNSNTTGIMPYDIRQNFNMGIFVDIFVYDAVPDNRFQLKKLLIKQKICRLPLNIKLYGCPNYYNPKFLLYRICTYIYFGFYTWSSAFKKFDDTFRRNKISENENIACIAFRPNLLHLFIRDKRWYDETILMPFEDIMMPIPIGYDQILTKQYGNYMKPVKAPPLHENVIYDVNRPWQNVLSELRSR